MKHIFFLLFIIIGFVPYFGTIDKIGSQWLYLSIINGLVFLYLSIKTEYISLLKKYFAANHIKSYIFFIFFAFISLIFSNNFSLSIVDFSRILTTLILSFNLFILFSHFKLSLNSAFLSISLILFFEILYSLIPFYEFLQTNSILSIDISTIPNAMRGVTGNKNVFSADIAFKLPFVLYLTYNGTFFQKVFAHFIFLISLITVFLLSSRAVYISVSIVLILYTLYTLFTFFSSKKFIHYIFNLFCVSLLIVFIKFLPSSTISVSNRINSISLSDTSTNQRIELWSNAIDYISKSPFLGCGIGNWKVESLPYWKDLLSGYTIPYHAHNDFLEITAEIGVLGGLSYLFIFIFIFHLVFKKIKSDSDPLIPFIILSCLSVYFIDAFLNFPLERAISQVNFAILISLTSFYFINEKN